MLQMMRHDLTRKVEEQFRAWGSEPALVELPVKGEPVRISAGQFQDQVREIETLLRAAGIEADFPVALMLGNSALFASVFLAILAMDAVPLPIQVDYRAMELDEIVTNASPQAFVVAEPLLSIVAPYVGDSGLITAAGTRLSILRKARVGPDHSRVDDSVAAVLYTYRGQGYPLGALVPPGQFLHGVSVIHEVMESTPGEAILSLVSLGHIFGLVSGLFLPLLCGLTAVVPCSLHPDFIFRALSQHRIACAVGVPEVFAMLWRFRRAGLGFPALRLLICGGSLLSEVDYGRFQDFFGAEVAHGYGLTELTPVSRNIPGKTRPGTVGPVCRGIRVRIEPNDPVFGGEIQLQAADMSRGYLRRPNETAAALDGNWFRTGDRGIFRGDHLVFLEEIKGTCKVNGRLVDRKEVERAILSAPDVRGAEVRLAEPNVLEARVIFENGRGGQDWIRDLRRHLCEKIAPYKIPKRFLTDNSQ